MTMNGHARHANIQCLIGALLLALVFAGPHAPVAVAQGDAPLDLAAMTLTPADVDDADLIWQGAQDYGLALSMAMNLDDYLTYLYTHADVDQREDDVRNTLDEAGFARAYQAWLSPMTVADGDAERTVVSYTVEYADAEGAADAFEFTQDETAAGDATDLEELDQLGDESEGTLIAGDDDETGEPYALLDTTVLLDRLHIGVMLLDWGGAEPNVDDAEVLIEALLERVETVVNDGDWGLSNQVVRLTGDTVSPYADAYLLRDGAATLLYNDEIDERELEEIAEEMGQTDEYRVRQRLMPANDDPDDDAWYYLSVLRFEDDDAAEAWIEERPDAIENYDAFEDVEFADEDDVDIGDAAFSYTAVSVNTGTHFHNITFQLGDLIIVLDLSGPTTVPAEAVLAVAEAQWTCLEIQNCAGPMELPEPLAEYIDDIR